MAIINDSSKDQIVKLLNLSDEALEKHFEIINESLDSRESIFPEIVKHAKAQSLDVNSDELYDIYSSLYNIARFYSNIDILPQFKSELNSKFNEAQNLRFQKIIECMNQRNLINKLATVHVKSRLENSILPRLKSFNLTYNYRILEEIKGKNRLIPIIQAVLRTERDTIDKSEEHVFQLIPNELDVLIEELKEFREKYKAFDNEFGV